MQRRWTVILLPRLLVCLLGFILVVETASASPRGGFFGAILGEGDEEDKPKPPVPPIGKTIRPLVVLRPLPRPVAPPAVPVFVESEVVGDEAVDDETVEDDLVDEVDVMSEMEISSAVELNEATEINSANGADEVALSAIVDEVSASPAKEEAEDSLEIDRLDDDVAFNAPMTNSESTEIVDDAVDAESVAGDAMDAEEAMGAEDESTVAMDLDSASLDELVEELYEDEIDATAIESADDDSSEDDSAEDDSLSEEAEIEEAELAEPTADELSLADQVPRESSTDGELVDGETSSDADADELAEAVSVPVLEWTPEMLSLRKAIRATFNLYKQPLSTQVMPPTAVMHACVAFGSETELVINTRTRQRVNAVGALCWNYPCAGKRLLVATEHNVMPRIGHGYQTKRGELLSTFAMSAISTKNEIRIGESSGTVGDLVRWEQASVQSGVDLSLTLFGLSTYLDADTTWTNAAGETWSLDRIAGEELSRKVSVTEADSIDRLMGLTRYVVWARKHDVPRTGRHLQVERYIARFHEHALKLQGRDGSWGPLYLGYSGSTDPAALARQLVVPARQESLYSTGSILLWLTMSLTPEQLQSPEIVRAVIHVNNGLASDRRREKLTTLSPHELAMSMRSLRAIAEYDRRVFVAAEKQPLAMR